MTWILTASGKRFDYADPQPQQIDILDIAQALAHECRYAGHARRFYSVAQHSVLVSQIVPREHALEALLHDAHEAYCKDIPRPLKALLPDYRAVEDRIDGVIRAHFGLPAKLSEAVVTADLVLLATERRDLMPHDDTPWPILDGIAPLPRRMNTVHPERAQAMFIRRWVELGGAG
jgi:hypothetical protein